MTTRNSSSVFMADFAGSDRRSVKAHLKGNSLRAKSFSTFTAVAQAVGRGDRAADDFKATVRFFFKRRDALLSFAKKTGFDETCRESHTLRRHRLHCLVGDIFNLQGNQGDGEP